MTYPEYVFAKTDKEAVWDDEFETVGDHGASEIRSSDRDSLSAVPHAGRLASKYRACTLINGKLNARQRSTARLHRESAKVWHRAIELAGAEAV